MLAVEGIWRSRYLSAAKVETTRSWLIEELEPGLATYRNETAEMKRCG